MLEIFSPYLPFISLILTIGINVALLISHAPWWSYLIGNGLLIVIFNSLGIPPRNFIGDIIEALLGDMTVVDEDSFLGWILKIVGGIFGFDPFEGGGGTGVELR